MIDLLIVLIRFASVYDVLLFFLLLLIHASLSLSRSVFGHFAGHFKSQSRALLQSLDDAKRKLIEKEMGSVLGPPDRNGDGARSQSTDRSAARRPASRNAAPRKTSSTSVASSSNDGKASGDCGCAFEASENCILPDAYLWKRA